MRKVHIKVEYDAILEEKREGILKSVNELQKVIHQYLDSIMQRNDIVVENKDGVSNLLLHYKVNRYGVVVEEVQGDKEAVRDE